MTQDETIEYNALGWVKKELDAVLNEARVALEAYIEDPGERDRLDECGMHIKQAQGTLQMVELFGAAMLAEEMSELLQAIAEDKVKNKDDAYEALIRAIIQLPDYLEHIQAGHKDVPIVLLPLMNDLRTARDVPLLSENVLFFPDLDMHVEPGVAVEEPASEKSDAEVQKLIRALRHSYQLALLGWFRDRDVEKCLKTIRAVLMRLQNLARIDAIRRFWWVAAALADALVFEGLERGLSTKQLLGKVDRQLKKMIDEGEAALADDIPSELIKNLLYYVATSESVSDQIKQVKKTYRLSRLLPTGQDLEAAKGQVGGLNVDILQTVAQGIREDLTEIKDGLEIFVHTEQKDTASLEPLADRLRKVADTLTMLGLGQAREMVLKDEAGIRNMASGLEPVSDDALLAVAGVMLTVEAALNDFISNRTTASGPTAADMLDVEEGHRLPDSEFRGVLKAVIREALVDMSRAKEAILEFISSPEESEQLQEVPRLLESIKGAISMLPMDRAVPVLDAIGNYVSNRILKESLVPSSVDLEALADAITSIEMYLESLEESRGDHLQIIQVGEESAARLSQHLQVEVLPEEDMETQVLLIKDIEQPKATFETPAFDLEDAETPEVVKGKPVADFGLPSEEPETEISLEGEEAETEAAELGLEVEEDAGLTVEPEEESLTQEARRLDIPLFDEQPSELPEVIDEEEVLTVQVGMPDLADLEIAPDEEKQGESPELEMLDLGEPEEENLTLETKRLDIPLYEEQASESPETIDEDEALTVQVGMPDLADLERAAEEEGTEINLKGEEEFEQPQEAEAVLDFELPAEVAETEVAELSLKVEEEVGQAIEPEIELEPQQPELEGEAPELELLDLGEPEEENLTLETKRLDIPLYEEQASDSPEAIDEEDVLTVQVGIPDLADLEIAAKAAEEKNKVSPEEAVADDLAEPSVQAAELPSGDEFRDLQAVVGEMDDEIMEIFLEEAEEEIDRIKEYLPRWENNQDDEDALTTMRRSFHTLKGSGRLVGAQLLGEFSWAFEDMLNRVIDHNIRAEAHVFGALHESLDALAQLVEQVKGNGEPALDVCALMAKAHAMSKGDFGKKFLGQVDEDESAEDLNSFIDEAEEESPFEEAKLLEESQDEIEEEVPTVAVEPPGIEEVILTSDEGLVPLDETHEDVTEEPVSEDIVLSTETLNLPDEEPSAETEEDTEVPTVFAPLLEEQQVGRMDSELLEIFSRESHLHLDTLRAISSGSAAAKSDILVSHDFIRAMHTLNGSARTAVVPEIFELCAPFERYAKLREEAGKAIPTDVQPLLAATIEHVQQVLEALANPIGVVPEGVELKQRILSLLEEEEAAAAEAGARSTQEPGESDQIPQGEPDIVSNQDAELVEIFIEEAEEILDASDGTLQQWIDDPSDREAVNELQRQLHTLKGGARMAGFKNIGDLSHAVESLIIKVVDGEVTPSEMIFTTLRKTTDRLSEMVELASKQDPIYPAPELIGALDRLRTGQAVAEEEIVASPVVSVPEPAIEVESVVEQEEPEPETAPELLMTEEAMVSELFAEPEVELPEPEAAAVEPEIKDEQKKKAQKVASQEVVRVRSELLDNLVNYAGEVNIYHSRLEQQVNTFSFNLGEFDQTVARLRDQLRRLEIETDAQILHNFEKEKEIGDMGETTEDFDPLEMDKYSGIQQLSRALAESVNDLVSIQELLVEQVRDTETLLLQQSRVSTDLQEGLMRTRMVQFSGIGPRLRRIVRQTASELGKKVDLEIIGEHSDLDRSVLDHMIAPLEHMIRNSVAHGIEHPDERLSKGKSDTGKIAISVRREGSEIIIEVTDDGAGIDLDKVRAKARKMGVIKEHDDLSDEDAMQLILESGFSTAGEVSQISGRGVGMDVVNNEIKQLGGVLLIDSSRGKGTSFRINLPFTLAINQALLVQTGDELFAVPLTSIEGIVRIASGELATRYDEKNPVIEYAAYDYDLKHLNTLLGGSQPAFDSPEIKYPVLLVHSGGHRLALQVEGLLGSREIVVKSVGPQISKVRGISGATILGDGRVVLILDVPTLVRMSAGVKLVYSASAVEQEEEVVVSSQPTIMVVDDSITIRKVTSRMLERNNFQVLTAKDGVDAVSLLAEETPDLMLLDIEMPRMDGYELATYIRNDSRLKDVPIIMITSRTGSKHRDRAINIGVNKYLGKPYQESELLEEINGLLEEQAG